MVSSPSRTLVAVLDDSYRYKKSLFRRDAETGTRDAGSTLEYPRHPPAARLLSYSSPQLSTIFPELPDFISSMASLNWLNGKWCVITGEMSRPLWIMAVILYQVSYISRP